jgi:RNA polymerase sigma factor (sigma-70 family)
MATPRFGAVLHNLHRPLLTHEQAGLTDGELLGRFIMRRDEAAFEALLLRHGPMVLGVCRRVLGNEADVEDAFQATLLVLARKAASIRPRGMVGNWLHGVAHRTALKARAMRTRRLAREREAAARPKPEGPAEPWDHLAALLDEGLNALPDKYRTALILCELEGKSIKEAAQHLGCPQGTVGTRLARGRRLLIRWLGRRGVALSGGAITAAIARSAAAAGVPPLLMSSTVKAALLVAAGHAVGAGVVPARVASLAESVLKAMLLTKLKATAAVLLGVAVVAAAASAVLFPARAAEPPPARKAVQPAGTRQGKPATNPKPVIVRENAQIRSLAWSSNGKLLTTVGIVYELVDFTDGDGKPTGTGGILPSSTIKLWDPTTGKCKRSLAEEKHTYIAALAFSADGKTAALSASKHVLTNDPKDPLKFETEVRVMDARTWALKHKVKSAGFASALAFSPDGTRLALGGKSRLGHDAAFVRLWDVQKQKQIGAMEGGGYRVSCLAFSSECGQDDAGGQELLAAGDENGKVHVFDGRAAAARREFEGQGPLRAGGAQCVTGVGFSADGKRLVSGSMDRAVRFWDVKAGKLVRMLKGNQGPIAALAFSRDGRLFATAGGVTVQGKSKVEVILWDTKTGKPRKTFPGQTMPVNSLAFSPDGTTLAIGAGAAEFPRDSSGPGRGRTRGEVKLWKLQ